MNTKVFGPPPPGSDAARALGCRCPVLDNARGRGWMGGVKNEDGRTVYVISGNCPVHAMEGKEGK